jgi:hypothetical protein
LLTVGVGRLLTGLGRGEVRRPLSHADEALLKKMRTRMPGIVN